MVKLNHKELNDIVKFIVRNVDNIRRIILFGSVAQKGFGNDLDLALVTGPWKSDLKELDLIVAKRIKEICTKFPIDYFILPVNLIENHKNSIFLRMINTTGQILYMDKESLNEWVADAKLDYEQAICLSNGGYYKGACYYAQQCVEKLLKAKLFHYGWELKKTHSILQLTAELKSFGFTVEDIKEEDLFFLDSIYRGRYPGEQGLLPYGNPSMEESERSLLIATKVGTAMDIKLGKSHE